DIEKYIIDMNSANNPVNRASVLVFSRLVSDKKYKMHELPEHYRIKFSDGRMTRLFKRIRVKSRYLYSEEASVDLISDNIVEQLKDIQEMLEPYDPVDILNFDETGLYYEQQPTRSISKTQLGGSKKSKNRFTIDLLTNADGSYKGHPIIIGKNKNPRGFKTQKSLLRRMTVGNDTYVEYHHSPSAWMNSKIFTEYMTRLDRSFKYNNRKAAILLDNTYVHKINKEFDNIKLIFLPANTTSKLQLLDAGMYLHNHYI
ncbi:DDE-domain-containing protein, partial [Backusella circina FSU 941]